MDREIKLDEACLGDEGKAQCIACGKIKMYEDMKCIEWMGNKRRDWYCWDCGAVGIEEEKIIKVKILDDRARLPRRAHASDVGYDLFVSETTVCAPGEFTDIPAGIAISLPKGCWGHIVGRSSAMRTLGLLVVPAIIDQGYTGNLFSGCWNLRAQSVEIQEGDRIAQLIVNSMITPDMEIVEDLPQTDRGGKGFGSSGR